MFLHSLPSFVKLERRRPGNAPNPGCHGTISIGHQVATWNPEVAKTADLEADASPVGQQYVTVSC